MVKVLLDTDIGSDIDDAVCLAYLLAQPDCNLLGITTVTGEADRRAALAARLCAVAGRDVPIFPGTEPPLLVAPRQPQAPQAAALADPGPAFPRGRHLAFLAETIRAHPDEIVLLTIGPLTNIGLLFAADPSLPPLLRGVVTMGGRFAHAWGWGGEEWNIVLDPHAAAIVYRAPVPSHRSIGLDVSLQVSLPEAEVRRRFAVHPLLREVLTFAGSWFAEQDRITFHDPLAAASIFDPAICRFVRGEVAIELTSPRALGQTYWTPDPAGRHEVALGVDPDGFFGHYFSVFM